MDEVDLKIRGKVDEWRILRDHAFLIHCSTVEKPVNKMEALPLPFDDELIEEERRQMEWSNNEGMMLYETLKVNGYFDMPIEDYIKKFN